MKISSQLPRWLPLVLVPLLLTVTLWAYLPGLGGELIFDDYPNLMPWEQLGDIDSLQKALTFIFSGANPPGRPLALATFLIDDQSWSPDIFSLKRTNLAIHLLNSLLVLWLCIGLLRHLLPGAGDRRQLAMAFFASAIWALHPLQVSNVAYIIQRMNLLSTLLELAGMLMFLQGRERLAQHPRQALLICSVGIGLFMPAAVLAKENGLLLCAFALLIDRFCFPPSALRLYRAWKLAFLWFPLLAFLSYCLKEYEFFTLKITIRDFTSWERLLTQGRVMTDYLSKLLLPRLSGSTLFYDNFTVSRSLLQPASTLACWLLLLGLLGLAWWLRRRLPLVSFGLFFYFTGHLMESTLLPLELYFEHRNYLPQLGLWLALAGLLDLARSHRLQMALAAGSLALVAMLAVMTRHNSALWSDSDLQVAMWYRENPGSLRSIQAYTNVLLDQGNIDAVHQVIGQGLREMPKSLALTVSERYISCYLEDRPTSFADLPAFARTADYDLASVIMLERMRGYALSQQAPLQHCQPIERDVVGNVYRALLANPRFGTRGIQSRLHEYLAEIAVARGDLNDAIAMYDLAFRESGSPVYPYRQATLLESAGLPADALRFLDKAEGALTARQKLVFPELEQRILAMRQSLAGGKD